MLVDQYMVTVVILKETSITILIWHFTLQKDLEKRYAVLLKKKKDALEVIEDVEHALQERRVLVLGK